MSEFQMALLFPFVPIFSVLLIEFILDITSNDDDDDTDGGKGIRVMQPVPVTVPSGA